MSLPRGILAPAAVAGAVLIAAVGARGETLADAVALAYQTNPQLQAQRANLRATDENFVQAEAGYRPTATLQGSVTTSNSNEAFSQTFQGNSQVSNAQISITQPLYTGGRVASQVTQAEATVLAGRAALRVVEQQVLQQVIQAYVDTRRDLESVAIAQENVTLLKRQLDESQARFEVGEITRTDVAQTQARVAAAVAQLSAAHAQLANSRAAYTEIVGQSPGDLAPEPPLVKFLPTTIDQAFDVAEHKNPQVWQADYTEQASAAKVAAVKAQTRPTVSLQASLGYAGGNLGLTTPFANFGHAVSASAVATVPLFTGGLTSSQIRQAAESNNVDRIGIETTRRQVLFNVSQAWNQLLGSRATLVANEEEVKAANIAFEGTRQEARVGLRTTLDVLIAEQDLGNAELALVNARHDEYIAASSLLAAMGSLMVETLTTGVPVYDPRTNFDKVRRSYDWSPLEPAVKALDKIGAPKVIERPAPAPVVQDTTPPPVGH